MAKWIYEIIPVGERTGGQPPVLPSCNIEVYYNRIVSGESDDHRCEPIGSEVAQDSQLLAMQSAIDWMDDPDNRNLPLDAAIMAIRCAFQPKDMRVWLLLAELWREIIDGNTYPATKAGETMHYTVSITIDQKP